MKLIDQYKGLHKQLEDKLTAGTITLEELGVLQEVKYRICVLDTLRVFCASAPKTTDTTKLCYHYQLVSTYLKFICSERRFGNKTDEDGLKKRETAGVSLVIFPIPYSEERSRTATQADMPPLRQDTQRRSIQS